jgi:hypothetical protein
LRIENPIITRTEVTRKLFGIVNSKNYTGGYKGIIAFAVWEKEEVKKGETRDIQKLYYVSIRSLKK